MLERMIDRFIERASSRAPDLEIFGTRDTPAVKRWWVIPRNRFFNIYLHQFLQDDGQDLHDHPWPNLSVPLRQGYRERLFQWFPVDGIPLPATKLAERRPGRVYFRRATTPHQVVVDRAPDGREIPSWSLFFTGPKINGWGFWCQDDIEDGAYWVPYTERTDPDHYGKARRV